jgi:hypothetical protein
MRTVAIALLFALLLPAGAALAERHEHHGATVNSLEVRPPAEWGPRHDQSRASFVMLTGDRGAEMLLTRRVVALQFSDRTLRRIDRDFAREREEDEGVIADAIKGAVLGSVRALLDHSVECPLDQLRDVRYRDGRLELVARNGERLFEDLEIDDRTVLESFSPADARAFVHEFQRLKGRDR